MKRRLILFSVLTLILVIGCFFGQPGKNIEHPIRAHTEAGQLENGFLNPPDSVRPWVFWNWGWKADNVNKEDLTKDLEELRRQGIGGLLFADGGPDQLSPLWRENFRYLVHEAGRLGFEFNANVANGFGTGGPWATPEMAAKKLVYTETQVDGPQGISLFLPEPERVGGFYRDVAVIAFPEHEKSPVSPLSVEASSTLGGYVDEWNWPVSQVIDRDPGTCWRAGQSDTPVLRKPEWLDLEFSEPLAASGLFIAPAGDGGPGECELQAYGEDGQFKTVLEFTMEQGRPKRLSFPLTMARRFRLVIRSSCVPDEQVTGDSLYREHDIVLSAYPSGQPMVAEAWLLREGDEPYLRRGLKWWAFKSGNRSFWDWPKQGPAALHEEYPGDEFDLRSSDVIDLTGKMNQQGELRWEVPAGRWTILRFGLTLHGARPRSNASGYQLDLFKTSSADATFEHAARPMIEDACRQKGKTLSGIHLDSYEYGVYEHGQLPTWTESFPEQFRKHRGYNLLHYMPVLAGRIVDSRQVSDRFLWDYRRTLGDLYTGFYKRLTELVHQYDLEANSENGYGTYPFPHIDGLEAFGAGDNPQGEFWTATPIMSQFFHFCNSVRTAASAAHIYGKRKVQAEAFSTWLRPYEAYPGLMKQFGDQAFCDGLQQCVIFVSSHQHDDIPGGGTGGYEIINRHITWHRQSKVFFDYLARCQYLLQQGQFVADALYYYGEGTTAFVPDKQFLKPALPSGYDFDGLNKEVLLHYLSVDDGRLVLPDGMSYRVLVLPEARGMSPMVLRRIRELIQKGATVLGNRPLHPPGLNGYPQCDSEVEKLAAEMWAPVPAPAGDRRIGLGRLVWGMDVGTLLAEMKTVPDFEVLARTSSAPFEFIHRRLESTDMYFVVNTQDTSVMVQALFRVQGKKPEIWDPVTGCIWNPADGREEMGRTVVPIHFAPYQSYFVVFRRTTSEYQPKWPAIPVLSAGMALPGPWIVRFDPGWGGPESVIFEELEDWTHRPEEGIRYYSGTATYSKTFDMPPTWRNVRTGVWLELGELKNLAEVRLNGMDLGTLWTKPFRADITGALKATDNTLEIDVVNLWTNRLIGDAGQAPENRYTRSDVADEFKQGDPLLESGLIGPVLILRALSMPAKSPGP
jgi:hypothetical protein